jgi:hypothetical protein
MQHISIRIPYGSDLGIVYFIFLIVAPHPPPAAAK